MQKTYKKPKFKPKPKPMHYTNWWYKILWLCTTVVHNAAQNSSDSHQTNSHL